ncbi:MAG TPA: NAD(P)H-hydrate epimerase, partial [Burkholderiaceae bacterium]|nr:NAD(P)H-hydrate epimerase [Burkholderiaceae bacterium]
MGTPLLTISELRAVQGSAQANLPAGTLMARAGAAVAAVIASSRSGEPMSICIVAGPGNNGGDGYAAASELRDAGHRITCFQVSKPVSDDARAALDRWQSSDGAVRTEAPSGQRFDVIV